MTSRDPPPSRGPSKLFVVDGTGSSNEDEYRKDMSNGFCKRLENQCAGVYWRGPTLLGNETTDIAKRVVDAVNTWHCSAEGVGGRVFLAGHSRGGAAVIFAAQTLAQQGTPVEAMFLFDAVDQTVNNLRSSESIPSKVRYCFHAMRDQTLASRHSEELRNARDALARCVGLRTGRRTLEEEAVLDQMLRVPIGGAPRDPCHDAIEVVRTLFAKDNNMKRAMRAGFHMRNGIEEMSVAFGNCGTKAIAPCKLSNATFAGSHGAIGGAPLVDGVGEALIETDRAAVAAVGAWMGGHLASFGLFMRT